MLLVLLLIISGNFYVNCYSDYDGMMLYKTIQAYSRLLNFTNQYIDFMNMDGIIGMTFSEAHFNELRYLDLPSRLKNTIELLKHKTHEARQKGFDFLQNELYKFADQSKFQSMLKLVNWKFWAEKSIHFKKHSVINIKTDWKENYLTVTSPNGAQSDFCLSELLKTDSKRLKECAIDKTCRKIYFDSNNAHGYALTHRVLYWTVFLKSKCIDKYSVNDRKRILCSKVLSETKGILELDPFDRYLSDLFLEQVLFCGMEGYEEFLENKEWLNTVLSWQNEHGCFESYKVDKKKRASNFMVFGCENHMTGLSFGYLSLNLKYLLATNRYKKLKFLM